MLAGALSGCANLERPYYLRAWERNRLAAEKARSQHHYETAEDQARQAVNNAERLGSSDFRLAVSLYDLAAIYILREKYKLAFPLLKRTLQVLDSSLQASPRASDQEIIEQERARAFLAMGELNYRKGDFKSALRDYTRARSTLEKWCDANRLASGNPLGLEFVRSLWGIAESSYALKDLKSAGQSFRLALRLAEANAYPVDKELRLRYGSFLKEQGLTDTAELAAETWRAWSEKGRIAAKEKNYVLARECFAKALASAINFRPDDVRLAYAYKSQADACIHLGDIRAAAYYLERSLKVCLAKVDPLVALTDDVMNDLANVRRSQMKYAEAESMRLKEFALRKQYYGIGEKTGETMLELAHLQLAQSKQAEARRSAEQALSMILVDHGMRRKTASTFQVLSDLFLRFNDYPRAESTLNEALNVWKGRGEFREERVTNAYFRLANLALIQKKKKEEKNYYDLALMSLKDAFPKHYLSALGQLERDLIAFAPNAAVKRTLLGWQETVIALARASSPDDLEFQKQVNIYQKRADAQSLNMEHPN